MMTRKSSKWPEKEFEEKMRPLIDDIYRQIFGSKLIAIARSVRDSDNERTLFMDIELAIDTHLTFADGSVLTFQEKTLKNSKKRYQSFTFEYYNDPKAKDRGEWFKLAAQLYYFGYANAQETGYDQWLVLDIAKLRTEMMKGFTIKEIEKKYLRTNRKPSKANFFAIPFTILRGMDGVLVYESDYYIKPTTGESNVIFLQTRNERRLDASADGQAQNNDDEAGDSVKIAMSLFGEEIIL